MDERYADAHNHIHFLQPKAALQAARAAIAAGVSRMAVCAAAAQDWQPLLELYRALPQNIVPCLGLHPWHVTNQFKQDMASLEALLTALPQAVIGETGLDKTPGRADFSLQKEAFALQLELARKTGRPAVIHCVKAWGPLLQMLRAAPPVRFMLHSYGGAPELVAQLAAMGAYFSFSQKTLKTPKARQSLLRVPQNRLLFETDCPAPDAAVTPADIIQTVQTAADILAAAPERTAAVASFNFEVFVNGENRSC